LGGLALGDIGQHFPDTDPNYKNADSAELLKKVYELIKEKDYTVGNLDSIIVMQKPKLASFIPKMQERIAKLLSTEIENISVKATTTEKLGFIGREEGISAFATVLLIKV